MKLFNRMLTWLKSLLEGDSEEDCKCRRCAGLDSEFLE